MRGKKAKAIRKRVREIREKYNCMEMMKKLAPKATKERQVDLCVKRYKKLVRAGILTICALLIVNISYAMDKIGLLNDVNPKLMQANLAKRGFKVDFNIVEKTDDSWGVLGFDDKGLCIFTYGSVNIDNLPIVTEAMWESMEE